jgi:hypothetical protein
VVPGRVVEVQLQVGPGGDHELDAEPRDGGVDHQVALERRLLADRAGQRLGQRLKIEGGQVRRGTDEQVLVERPETGLAERHGVPGFEGHLEVVAREAGGHRARQRDQGAGPAGLAGRQGDLVAGG